MRTTLLRHPVYLKIILEYGPNGPNHYELKPNLKILLVKRNRVTGERSRILFLYAVLKLKLFDPQNTT